MHNNSAELKEMRLRLQELHEERRDLEEEKRRAITIQSHDGIQADIKACRREISKLERRYKKALRSISSNDKEVETW